MTYNRLVLGEKNWIHEHLRWNHSGNNYYFDDSPMSADDSFPDIARGEIAKLSKEEYMKTPEAMKA